MVLANTTELIVCFFAAASLGATVAPLNAAYVRAEFAFYLEDMGPAYVVVVPRGVGNVEAEGAAKELGVLVAQIGMDKGGVVDVTLKAASTTVHNGTGEEGTWAAPEDGCLFLHTSGTTAKPKGVPLTHANLLCSMRNIAQWYELGERDRGYVVMPLFHVHGLMSALFAPLWAGGSIVLPALGAGFQVGPFWRHVSQYACTWYTAVPSMHQLLLADRGSGSFEQAGKPSLRFIRSCSSSLPPLVLQQLESAFGAPVLEAYAMTEACHQMSSNPLPKHGVHKAGSVGLGTNVEIIVVGADEASLPRGQVGEVCVRGANVMKGYHNRPAANAEAFLKSGFFRTGDLGYFDEDGYLFLVGRIKEQINRGGEKIAPLAIDNALIECPGVQTLCAFAVPHKALGEVVGCAVVLRPGSALTLGDLNRFGMGSRKLQTQWLPQVLVVCDQIPKGPTGKVQRVKLASLFGLPVQTDGAATYSWDHLSGLHKESGPVDDGQTLAKADAAPSAIALARMVEQVIAVALTESLDMEFQLDSFSAVRLAQQVRRQWGKRVRPEDLLDTTTVNKLYAKIMLQRTSGTAAGAEVDDWEQEATRYPLPTLQLRGVTSTSSSVLLTGVTGFLGSHILAALLSNPAVDRVFCLVRAGSEEEAREKLRHRWSEQRIGAALDYSRVVMLLGDAAAPQFGLPPSAVEQMRAAHVGSVIHNAAHVNHALAYTSLREHNVDSIVHAAMLCEALGGAFLSFVSTAGVCGRRLFVDAESPQRLPAEDLRKATGYVQSKWIGERLVERLGDANPEKYAIFRPGAVTGDSKTGACNLGDSINRYVIGMSLLGSAPPIAADVQVDMSPVNWVAGAVAHLTLHHAKIGGPKVPVYTLDNARSMTFGALIDTLNTFLKVPIRVASSYGEWFASLTQALDHEAHGGKYPNPLRDLRGALALSPPLFGTSACRAHAKLLTALGHAPPPIDATLIKTYLAYFVDCHAIPPGSVHLL